jgi:hypothetical protein
MTSKKIRLDLDDLKVESFVTSRGRVRDGTVFGMSPNTVCEDTCNEVSPTCVPGCPDSNFCNWTTDENEASCTGGGTGGTGGTLPPHPTTGGDTGHTCPEDQGSCNGMECQPE